MKTRSDQKIWLSNLFITLLSVVFFIPFLGGVHLLDWDEINFAESAREMIETGDYLTVRINFVPFWEKPPLFIWMQVISMKVFGINEFAARFPNAICGIISLLVLFNTGRKLVDIRFGLYWVLLYAGSLLPFFYFKSGIIDPWFNLFIFLAIYQFFLYCKNTGQSTRFASASAFFIGLAVLTKGPVAFLIFALAILIFLIINKFRVKIRYPDVVIYLLVLAFTGGFWFILQILKGNFTVIADFIVYQIRLFRTEDAGHGGFLFYHFVVLFAGVFPASIFALPVLLGSGEEPGHKKVFYSMMLVLFWVVLVLFTIVRTKIVHYSSLCYFPLTFLAAWALYHRRCFTGWWKRIVQLLTLILGLILVITIMLLTQIEHFKEDIISHNWIGDPFARACLMAEVDWKGYEPVAGLVLFAGISGFAFLWSKKHHEKAFLTLTCTMPVFMFVAMFLIVPRVEAYSQRAVVEFFTAVSDQDAYLETVGYKSYAHLFYGKIRNHSHEQAKEEQWLLNGPIDKPAYFSLKVNRKEEFIQDHPDMELLYEKNGFVFFKRKAIIIK